MRRTARPLQLPEITIVQKPSHNVRRDLACALLIKLVPGRELDLPIGASQIQARNYMSFKLRLPNY
jgi:hypothetical protein